MFEPTTEEQEMFEVYQEVRYNFSHPDKEGYVFLTNIMKGETLPIEFAQEMGFTSPEFDIRNPKIPDNEFYRPTGLLPDKLIEKNIGCLLRTNEGIWVRERFAKKVTSLIVKKILKKLRESRQK